MKPDSRGRIIFLLILFLGILGLETVSQATMYYVDGVSGNWKAAAGKPEKAATVAEVVSPNPEIDIAAGRYSSVLGYDKIPSLLELKRTNILNTLVERYGYTSYLEIGQGHREDNFDWIRCLMKLGVDPDRSLNAA